MGKFNKQIKECVANIELMNNVKLQDSYTYETQNQYNSTLNNQVKGFKLTKKQKTDINVIWWNERNNDGLFSATIAQNYLKEEGKANIEFIRTGQHSGTNKLPYKVSEDSLRDKHLLVVDLVFDASLYEVLSKLCKSVIVIDDHEQPSVNLSNVTIISSNSGHGSCALCWKIFYPKKKVPKVLMMVDLKDSVKFARFLPYSDLLSSALQFRFLQNPLLKNKWNQLETYDQVWQAIDDPPHFWVIIGEYMKEVQENIKYQIAINAQIRNFQGYKVGVLNYDDPVLYKRVARQICTNMGDKIDFAVLWGWQYTQNAYVVHMLDHHQPTNTIHLGNLAKQLGNIGGHPKGGGGHLHIGNFYWPRKGDKDIWTLFEKKYI